MSRLDPKVSEENRLAWITAKHLKVLDALRYAADLEVSRWLKENPIIGELQTEKGKSYYYWNYVSDSKVEVKPFYCPQ
jgi:hypothetical protein